VENGDLLDTSPERESPQDISANRRVMEQLRMPDRIFTYSLKLPVEVGNLGCRARVPKLPNHVRVQFRANAHTQTSPG
jgi:hypothetical protein